MAVPGNVRVRLVFDKPPERIPNSSADSMKWWFLVEKGNIVTIDRLVCQIISRFDITTECQEDVQLSLDGCLLPPWESVDILRDNDLITVTINSTDTKVLTEYKENVLSAGNLKGKRKRSDDNDAQHQTPDGIESSTSAQCKIEADIGQQKRHKRKHKTQNDEADVDEGLNGNILSDREFNDAGPVLQSNRHDLGNRHINRESSSYNKETACADASTHKSFLTYSQDNFHSEVVRTKKPKRSKSSRVSAEMKANNNSNVDHLDLGLDLLNESELSVLVTNCDAGVEIDQDMNEKKKKKKKKSRKTCSPDISLAENIEERIKNDLDNNQEDQLNKNNTMQLGVGEPAQIKVQLEDLDGPLLTSSSDDDDKKISKRTLSNLQNSSLKRKRKRIRKNRKRKRTEEIRNDSSIVVSEPNVENGATTAKKCQEYFSQNIHTPNHTIISNTKSILKLCDETEINMNQSTSGLTLAHSESFVGGPKNVEPSNESPGIPRPKSHSKKFDTPRPPLFLSRLKNDLKHTQFNTDDSSDCDQNDVEGISSNDSFENALRTRTVSKENSDYTDTNGQNKSFANGSVSNKMSKFVDVTNERLATPNVVNGNNIKLKNVIDEIRLNEHSSAASMPKSRLESGDIRPQTIQEIMMDMSESFEGDPRNQLQPEMSRTKKSKLTSSNPFANAQIFSRQRRKNDSNNKTDALETTTQKEPPPVRILKDYSHYPELHAPPNAGDKIAYKMIDMSENYTPVVSEYKEATVVSYDVNTKRVVLDCILSSEPDQKSTMGKFDVSIEYENEIFTNVKRQDERISVMWSLIMEPRLLTS